MDNQPSDKPKQLRELAERAFRLSSSTLDSSAHDALTLYRQELLAKGEKLEAEGNDSD